MSHLKPQTTLGGFTLLTLLLASTVIGRVLGLGFDEALYLAALFLIGIIWILNRFLLRRVNSSIHEIESDDT